MSTRVGTPRSTPLPGWRRSCVPLLLVYLAARFTFSLPLPNVNAPDLPHPDLPSIPWPDLPWPE